MRCAILLVLCDRVLTVMQTAQRELRELTLEVDERGWSALHYAARAGATAACAMLLESVDLEARTEDTDETALQMALVSGSKETVDLLIKVRVCDCV